ncbi:uncharacterized protein LOC118439218 [Folsomia candida]|uniref:uncharacterized protein LOC118439218 n=1 Tax=Folsomia candida TaxID=158441 RepID=UPI0016055CEC|nr:uncharacterized protein LOC118439218 [Folsomia candida]
MIFMAYLSIFFVQRVLWHPMALWQTTKIRSLLESMGQLGLLDSPSIFGPQFYILSIGSVVSAWTMVSVMSKDLDNLFEDSSDFRGYKYLPLNLLVQGTGTPIAAEIFTHAANVLCEIVFTVFISLFIYFHRAVRKSLTQLDLHLENEHPLMCHYCGGIKAFGGHNFLTPLTKMGHLMKILAKANSLGDQFIFVFGTMSILILITSVHVLLVTVYRVSNSAAGDGQAIKQTMAMVVIVLFGVLKMVVIIEVGQDIKNKRDKISATLSYLGTTGGKQSTYDPSVCPLVLELRQLMGLEKFEICPSNFFTLDRRLIATMISTVVTFVIVIAQMKESERNG